MDVIKNTEKKHLNTSERCHIYKISKDRLRINGTYIEVLNVIFEALQTHIPNLLRQQGAGWALPRPFFFAYTFFKIKNGTSDGHYV